MCIIYSALTLLETEHNAWSGLCEVRGSAQVPDLVSEEMGFKLRFWILKPASRTTITYCLIQRQKTQHMRGKAFGKYIWRTGNICNKELLSLATRLLMYIERTLQFREIGYIFDISLLLTLLKYFSRYPSSIKFCLFVSQRQNPELAVFLEKKGKCLLYF